MHILYMNFNLDDINEILIIILYYLPHTSFSLQPLLWLFYFLGFSYDVLIHFFSYLIAYRAHL